MTTTSTPNLFEFDPTIIPYQYQVLEDIRKHYDYSVGTHEVLLSGSVGSAKSLLVAHIAVTHCLFNKGAKFLIGRLSMPALRSTLFQKILEHLAGALVEGKDYFVNLTTAQIKFRNGSAIMSRSWSDRKFFKVRSLELSGAAIEETSENEEDEFYREIKMRVGRLPHVKENIIVHATNPDGQSHWLYKYFIQSDSPTRHVYYSVTTDNPFLPAKYIEQLKNDLDPKLARRMIYGEWVDITSEVIYHSYDQKTHYKKGAEYQINPRDPVHISFDFNIGHGKPMSCVLFQYDKVSDHFHFFEESVIEGARTAEIIEDLDARGLLKPDLQYIINGDSSGKNRDTRNIKSDYDIIKKELENRGIRMVQDVPVANPPIRTRHNRVNAYLRNESGLVRISVYGPCKTVDEGFRLTKIKEGAGYVEDDSKHYQHCLTAVGYGIVSTLARELRTPQKTIQL